MTVTVTCDICLRSTKITMDAHCNADHKPDQPQMPPQVRMSPVGGGSMKWTKVFIGSEQADQCENCTEDRQERLAPKLKAITEDRKVHEEEQLADALEDWISTRRPANACYD